MDWFSQVYLTAPALGRLPVMIFVLVIAVFLLFHPDRSRHSRAAGLQFFFLTLTHLGYFLHLSVRHPVGAVGFYLTALFPIVGAFMVEFSYRFPRIVFDRERRIVVPIVFGLAVLAFLEYAVFAALAPVKLSVTGYASSHRALLVPVVTLVLVLWGMGVFVRKTLYHSEIFNARPFRITDLIRPGGKEARTCRNFLLFLILELANGIFLASEIYFRQFPHLQMLVISSVIFFFLYSFYVIIFLQYYGGSVAVSFKILGFGLVTSLLVVVLAVHLHLWRQEALFDQGIQAELSRVVERYELAPGSFIGEGSSDTAIHTPASERMLLFVRFGQDGSSETLYDATGQLAEQTRLNLWEIAPRLLEYEDRPRYPGRSELEQRVGRPYHLRVQERNLLLYPLRIAGGLYGVGFDFLEYRKFIHESAGGILMLYLFALVVNLILLPLLLGRIYSQPLRQLVGGLYESEESIPLIMRFGATANEIEILNEALEKVSAEREAKKRLEAEYRDLKQRLAAGQEKEEKEEKDDPSATTRERIQRVEDYLKENYSSDLSREGLAALVDLSPGRLGKYFRQVTGLKISEYTNQLRIERAARLLEASHKTVLEIAYEVGFESLRTFNRVFLQQKGVNPQSFRDSLATGPRQ